MADVIKGLFSAAPGLERVNIFGLIVMVLGVALTALAGKLSRRFPEAKQENMRVIFKLSSLVICVIGFAIAVY